MNRNYDFDEITLEALGFKRTDVSSEESGEEAYSFFYLDIGGISLISGTDLEEDTFMYSTRVHLLEDDDEIPISYETIVSLLKDFKEYE